MKITKSKLVQLIKEELQHIISEGPISRYQRQQHPGWVNSEDNYAALRLAREPELAGALKRAPGVDSMPAGEEFVGPQDLGSDVFSSLGLDQRTMLDWANQYSESGTPFTRVQATDPPEHTATGDLELKFIFLPDV